LNIDSADDLPAIAALCRVEEQRDFINKKFIPLEYWFLEYWNVPSSIVDVSSSQIQFIVVCS